MRLSMLVWDLPLRLYHAALAALLVVAFATGLTHHPDWHVWTGRALMVLVIWRAIWGVVGSQTARFSSFLVNPLSAWRRPGPGDDFGHAAAGGWLLPLVWLWLAVVLIGAQLGLPAHAALALGLLGLLVLHLVFVAAATVRGDAPLRAIITGKVKLPATLRVPRRAGLGQALLALAIALGLVILVSRGLP
jgi:hypothetical protein